MGWFSFSSDNNNFFTNIGATISSLGAGILTGIGLGEKRQDDINHIPHPESDLSSKAFLNEDI